MKFPHLVLSRPLLVISNVGVSATNIKGDIKDIALCDSKIIEADCRFDVDTGRRRRRLGGVTNHGAIKSCRVKLDGENVDSTVPSVDDCEVKFFDKESKGDEVKLHLFASIVKLNNGIIGLIKRETFEHADPYPDVHYPINTVKTFSMSWSGCM